MRIQRKTLSINEYDVVFGVGPPGAGKTLLAVYSATQHLYDNKVDKIIVTRPLLEAGEKLGYLPGTLKEKLDPFLMPIYDCFEHLIGKSTLDYMLTNGKIEIAPLGLMRGRTFTNCFIIGDEFQNTTVPQMKMFLTRLGFYSKMVITGDLSQNDLAKDQESGLLYAIKKLQTVEEISIVNLTNKDIQRNPLVSKINNIFQED
jgi:phosphate starvation-inducible PhoH-like protein